MNPLDELREARPMRELSLFTGIGGGVLGGLILGWEPVQFVDHDPYCQEVLAKRFPGVPIFEDVRDFHPSVECDIVTGGFPCQPFSQAGKRKGEDDERNMWPDAVRVLVESGAPLGFFENVPGLLSSGYFRTILGDLAEAGFDAEWCVLGADDVGATHQRKRLWILAYRHGDDTRMHTRTVGGTTRAAGRELALDLPSGRGEVPSGGPWAFDPADVADALRSGRQQDARGPHGDEGSDEGRAAPDHHILSSSGEGCELDPWLSEPYVGRVVDGVPSRVDRLRGLGNAQVPQCMAAAFAILAARCSA